MLLRLMLMLMQMLSMLADGCLPCAVASWRLLLLMLLQCCCFSGADGARLDLAGA
jgi:hypothetical protein